MKQMLMIDDEIERTTRRLKKKKTETNDGMNENNIIFAFIAVMCLRNNGKKIRFIIYYLA